jgi:hypothetical protein
MTYAEGIQLIQALASIATVVPVVLTWQQIRLVRKQGTTYSPKSNASRTQNFPVARSALTVFPRRAFSGCAGLVEIHEESELCRAIFSRGTAAVDPYC